MSTTMKKNERASDVTVSCGQQLNSGLKDALTRVAQLTHTWHTSTVIHGGCVQTFDEFIARCVSNDIERFVFDNIREAVDRTAAMGVSPIIVVEAITKATCARWMQCDHHDHIASKMSDVTLFDVRRPVRDDIRYIVDAMSCQPLSDAISEAVELAGACGRVFVTQGSSTMKVEIDAGHHITGAVHALSDNNAWSDVGVRVVVIDGVCDSVSELDAMFAQAVMLCGPVVIFARKFGDDLLNTLSVNNKRGTFTVIPIVLPFDNRHGCRLDDVALVCDAQLVTSDTWGSMINIDLATSPCVDALTSTGDGIVIRNAATNDACKHRLSQHMSTGDVSVGRMRCLSSDTVTLSVDNNADSTTARLTLAAVQAAIKSGVTDVTDDACECHPSPVLMTARLHNMKVIPSMWITAVERTALGIAHLFADSAVMITQQDV
jgi:hypothetical protein